ncbi:MAG: hypothetical protein LBG88_02055 [Christensenellaceae bacterium]|nr:hypothetical protein [Christensenellaceae bacterium]
MKFWKNGFFDEQSITNDRVMISDEVFEQCRTANMKGLDVIDKNGSPVIVYPTEEQLNEQRLQAEYMSLKQEIIKIKERIEQVTYGMSRDDFEQNKQRFAQIVMRLREIEKH